MSNFYKHNKEAHMQNPRLKKRHHIIPEVYLKQWRVLNQPKRIIVWYLDKKTLQGTGESPKNIFVKGHYFTEKELDGTRNHPVEDHLSQQIENRVNPLISILESSQPLTKEVRRDLWYFVSTMFTRTAWWREILQNLIEPAFEKGKRQAVDKVMQKSLEGKSRASRRQAQTKAYRRKISMDIEQESPAILEPLATSLATKLHPSLVMASLTLEDLQVYPFKIIRTDGISLLSSDTPCFLEEDPLILKFGEEELPSRAFVCPLTPNLTFIGALGLNTGYTTVNSEWVRRFNARVRANAKDKLIANTNAVDESWFLEDPASPPTMQEVIHQLELGAQKPQAKGFGKAVK
jgi:hypothetical protein